MKNCKVTVVGKNGEQDTIVLGALPTDPESGELQKTLDKCVVKFDTIDDDVVEKSTGMITRIELEGVINDKNRAQVEKLARWAMDTNADTEYRQVNVEMVLEGSNDKHGYEIKKVFVVDYEENHKVDGKDGASKYMVKLTQRAGNMENINIF